MCAARRLVAGGAALFGIATGVPAQEAAVTLDAGAAGVRYADSLDVTVATLSPALTLAWPAATLAAAGTYAQGGQGAWSLQGELAGSAFTPAVGRWRGELAGSAGGSAHEDGTRTGELLAQGRVHFMHGSWGAWAGGGAGRTWDGAVWRGVVLGDVGLWRRAGRATVLATATPAVVDDTIRYTDAEVAARWVTPRLELGALLGARAGNGLPTVAGSTHAWGSVTATVWMFDHLALVASAGSYPVDFTQGFPGGRFLSLGVRMALRRPARAASHAPPLAARDGGGAASPIAGFEVRSAPVAQRLLRVRAPGARRVEIAGDFTDWEPRPLARAADGWWTITLPIDPGTHQMNVRLDGTAWVVPPGLTTITDESGTSGLLVIPR